MSSVRSAANRRFTPGDAGVARPSRQTVTILLLVAVLLTMPESYKAGTEAPHPHAFFQGVIEAITGHQHEHDGIADATSTPDASTAAGSLLSPFGGANIPLAASATVDSSPSTVTIDAATGAPLDTAALQTRIDTPHVTSLKPAADQGSAITAIGLLVSIWFAARPVRRIWFAVAHLTGNAVAIEAPPPRRSCVN